MLWVWLWTSRFFGSIKLRFFTIMSVHYCCLYVGLCKCEHKLQWFLTITFRRCLWVCWFSFLHLLFPFMHFALTTQTFAFSQFVFYYLTLVMPSVLWRCWLGGRKGIRPVKNWAVGCWRDYLSGARCRLAYSPADFTTTHCLLFQ